MKKVLQLQGLDCANCAAELEREIAGIEGVSFASLAFVNQKLTVEYENDAVLERVIDRANHFEDVRVVLDEAQTPPEKEKRSERKKKLIFLAVAAVCLIACTILFEFASSSTVMTVARYITFGCLYLLVAYNVLKETVKNIAKGRIFDENFLMAIASIGAFFLGELAEGVMVVLLYELGETLQAIAVDSSRRSVTDLMKLKSDYATVLEEKHEHCACGCCGHEHEHEYEHEHEHEHEHETEYEQITKRPEDLQIGDVLLVRAGEKIPVDGVLIEGIASLDTKSLTGESELRTVKAGDELLSGCINAGSVFTMRVTRTYEDSAVKKMLDLVENASSGKAAPEKFITKFARYYTPIVCALALVMTIFVPLVSGLVVDGRLYFKDFARWANSALTFLVISCPCALVISVPLTYFSGVGACAKNGVLVKGATHLDTLAQSKTVAFDKTGTLTEGNFEICESYPAAGIAKEELIAVVASVEKYSAHPIAKAFETFDAPYRAEDVAEKAGRGLQGTIDGRQVLVGNAELLRKNGVAFEETESVYTLVYAAKNGEYLGAVEVGDRLRKEAKTAIAELKTLGFTRCVMLTGDNRVRAQKVAETLGIEEVCAELLPDEKMHTAESIKADGPLVYVGDGINDAPVMAAADCAASMGKLGSAAAVEASDLVLISDNLTSLGKGVKVARKTRKIVMQNIVFSIVMKVVFMALGAAGVLQLWLAVFADVGVMLCAVCNALRVRGKIK